MEKKKKLLLLEYKYIKSYIINIDNTNNLYL